MDIKTTIKQILLAFEQSSTSIKYNEVYKYDDGPGDIKQITLSFGITEYGNLKTLIKTYRSKSGKYGESFNEYIPSIGVKSLAQDTNFISLLKEAGSDPIMQLCQEQAYDSMYISPAFAWCEKNMLTLPLSKLVIADSFLQSGSILNTIRDMFSEKIPSTGGGEKEWVKAYCTARKYWLANHSRKILHKTTYRMDFMLKCIEAKDWELANNIYVANDVKIVAK